jgi:hypothetical protein
MLKDSRAAQRLFRVLRLLSSLVGLFHFEGTHLIQGE